MTPDASRREVHARKSEASAAFSGIPGVRHPRANGVDLSFWKSQANTREPFASKLYLKLCLAVCFHERERFGTGSMEATLLQSRPAFLHIGAFQPLRCGVSKRVP